MCDIGQDLQRNIFVYTRTAHLNSSEVMWLIDSSGVIRHMVNWWLMGISEPCHAGSRGEKKLGSASRWVIDSRAVFMVHAEYTWHLFLSLSLSLSLSLPIYRASLASDGLRIAINRACVGGWVCVLARMFVNAGCLTISSEISGINLGNSRSEVDSRLPEDHVLLNFKKKYVVVSWCAACDDWWVACM
jgi:hypothetical protein